MAKLYASSIILRVLRYTCLFPGVVTFVFMDSTYNGLENKVMAHGKSKHIVESSTLYYLRGCSVFLGGLWTIVVGRGGIGWR